MQKQDKSYWKICQGVNKWIIETYLSNLKRKAGENVEPRGSEAGQRSYE
jgi:hypothetical protein